MKTLTFALGVMTLSVAPFWIFAANIDSDEVLKTAIGAGSVTVIAGLKALGDMMKRGRG